MSTVSPRSKLTLDINSGPALRHVSQDAISCTHFDSKKVPNPYEAVGDLNISRNLRPGPIRYQDYGIDIARRFLVQPVVESSKQVSDTLQADTQTEAPSDPAISCAKHHRLVDGAYGVVTRLQDGSVGNGEAVLANQLGNVQATARQVEEGMSGEAPGFPGILADAPSLKSPSQRPGLLDVLSGPQTAPSVEQRQRWAADEYSAMAPNTLRQPETGKSKRKEMESTVEDTQRPRKVFRNRTGSSRATAGSEPGDLERRINEISSRIERERSVKQTQSPQRVYRHRAGSSRATMGSVLAEVQQRLNKISTMIES